MIVFVQHLGVKSKRVVGILAEVISLVYFALLAWTTIGMMKLFIERDVRTWASDLPLWDAIEALRPGWR